MNFFLYRMRQTFSGEFTIGRCVFFKTLFKAFVDFLLRRLRWILLSFFSKNRHKTYAPLFFFFFYTFTIRKKCRLFWRLQLATQTAPFDSGTKPSCCVAYLCVRYRFIMNIQLWLLRVAAPINAPQMDLNETKAAGNWHECQCGFMGPLTERTTLYAYDYCGAITAHSLLLPSFSTWLPLVAERVNSRRKPTGTTETMMSLAYCLFYLPSAMRKSTGGAISSGRLRSGLLSSSSGLVVAADDPWRNWLTLSFGCCDQTENKNKKKTKTRIMKILF